MTKRDLDRIAYITAHADGMLAGLVVASQCPIVLLLLIAKGSPVWVYLGAIALSLLTLWLVTRYATQRVGRVVHGAERRGFRRFLAMPAALAGVQLWRIDDHWIGAGSPSLTMIFIGVLVLWFTIRDWPFRGYRLAIPVVAFAAAVAHMWVVTEADLIVWRNYGAGSVVLAAMVVGLADYMTLLRMLGAARPEQVDAQRH